MSDSLLKQCSDEQLLREVVARLVDQPEALQIESSITDGLAVFEVACPKDDTGKLLGRKGAHANGIRAVFTAIFGKRGRRFHFNVNDGKPRSSRSRQRGS